MGRLLSSVSFFCRKMDKNCFEVDKVMAACCNGCGNSPRGEPLSHLACGLDLELAFELAFGLAFELAFGLDFRLVEGKAYGGVAQGALPLLRHSSVRRERPRSEAFSFVLNFVCVFLVIS